MLGANLQSQKVVLDGKVESLYVYFVEEARIAATLHGTLPDEGRVLVYVDAADNPVAMQFVDPLPEWNAENGEDLKAEMGDDESRMILFGMASNIVQAARSKQAAMRGVSDKFKPLRRALNGQSAA